jgi:hypothetical protein
MHLPAIASPALFLAVFFLPTQIFAQGNLISSQNLTLRFYTSSGNNSCDFRATPEAITFTTDSTGFQSHCFDIADLFNGNTTSGFINQTANFPGLWGEYGIRWELRNAKSYDASVNYSRVLYQQHIESLDMSDRPADKLVTVYGAKKCSEKDPNDNEGLLPWFGFSCLGEDQGSCGTTPYSIQSFRVTPTDADDGRKCWEFAERGQSGAVQLPRSVVAALLGTILAIGLAL